MGRKERDEIVFVKNFNWISERAANIRTSFSSWYFSFSWTGLTWAVRGVLIRRAVWGGNYNGKWSAIPLPLLIHLSPALRRCYQLGYSSHFPSLFVPSFGFWKVDTGVRTLNWILCPLNTKRLTSPTEAFTRLLMITHLDGPYGNQEEPLCWSRVRLFAMWHIEEG